MLILVTSQMNSATDRKLKSCVGKPCVGNCPMAEECQLNCPIFMCSIKISP